MDYLLSPKKRSKNSCDIVPIRAFYLPHSTLIPPSTTTPSLTLPPLSYHLSPVLTTSHYSLTIPPTIILPPPTCTMYIPPPRTIPSLYLPSLSYHLTPVLTTSHYSLTIPSLTTSLPPREVSKRPKRWPFRFSQSCMGTRPHLKASQQLNATTRSSFSVKQKYEKCF